MHNAHVVWGECIWLAIYCQPIAFFDDDILYQIKLFNRSPTEPDRHGWERRKRGREASGKKMKKKQRKLQNENQRHSQSVVCMYVCLCVKTVEFLVLYHSHFSSFFRFLLMMMMIRYSVAVV